MYHVSQKRESPASAGLACRSSSNARVQFGDRTASYAPKQIGPWPDELQAKNMLNLQLNQAGRRPFGACGDVVGG